MDLRQAAEQYVKPLSRVSDLKASKAKAIHKPFPAYQVKAYELQIDINFLIF